MALEDKLKQAKGALKENAGKLTGDKQLEAEGAVENTVAKVKDAANEVAEDIKKTADDAKNAIDGAISGLKNALGNDDK
ncbi:CsbD family protein [uncultured Veillonella sp.]|uniref:CsbD family protein n=1 Tax=uncultured Veillonella sp. TaxID=159268 RepID=UPI0028DCC4C4|nr:CsbD family protein [uncultured Veillonella sp.]